MESRTRLSEQFFRFSTWSLCWGVWPLAFSAGAERRFYVHFAVMVLSPSRC